jgi:hypothetical protein
MIYVERFFSLFVFVIVSTFFLMSFQYEMFSSVGGGVGGAFLPRVISLILLLLVSLYVFNVFRNKSTITNEENLPVKGIVIKQMSMAAILFACLFLIGKFGMLTTLGIFLLGSLRYSEKVPWTKSILFTILTIAFLYFLFVKWLNIRLPGGLLF